MTDRYQFDLFDYLFNKGFQRPVSANDLLLENSKLYPGRVRTPTSDPPRAQGPIAAAMIFHDPLDWAVEMQILTDVLIGDLGDLSREPLQTGGGRLAQRVPFFACNADFIYTTEHHRARYTQGAFVDAFRTLFEKFTGSPLEVNYYGGKPFPRAYEWAEKMLAKQMPQGNNNLQFKFYGVVG